MKITFDGHTLEGTPEEIKEMLTLMGAVSAEQKEAEEVEEATEEVETVEYNGKKYRNIGTVDAKDGDLVRFKNDYSRTTARKLYEVTNGKHYEDDGGRICYTVDGWGGKSEREVFRLVEEDTPTFKEGDRVKTLARSEFYEIEAGEIGEVTDIDAGLGGSDPYSIEVTVDDNSDYYRPQDLELVTEEPYKPTEGDVVVITANTNGSCNEVGDIGKVVSVDMNDNTAEVEVKCRGRFGNWTKFSEMRPATDEEKAQYEQAVKFAETGRKPGEFKKGDIVYGVRYNDSSVVFYGEAEDVDEKYDSIGVKTPNGRYHAVNRTDAKLIAPVESRVDTQ